MSITKVRHKYSTPAGLMILAFGELPNRSSSASCLLIQRLNVVVDTPAARANSHLYIAFIWVVWLYGLKIIVCCYF